MQNFSFVIKTDQELTVMPGVTHTPTISQIKISLNDGSAIIRAISNRSALVRGGLNINVRAMDELARRWLDMREAIL